MNKTELEEFRALAKSIAEAAPGKGFAIFVLVDDETIYTSNAHSS